MSIYRLLIHRFAVPLPSQGKAHEETQQPDKPQFESHFFKYRKKFQKNRTFLIPRVSMGVKLQLISPTKKEAP